MVVVFSSPAGSAVEAFSGGGGVMVIQAGLAELVFGHTDALGEGVERKIP